MHDDAGQIRARVARVVRERLVPAVHRDRRPLTVTAWAAPGEPVPFAQARVQEFVPFTVGSAWGRPWGTVWFHVTGCVPVDWSAVLDDGGFFVSAAFPGPPDGSPCGLNVLLRRFAKTDPCPAQALGGKSWRAIAESPGCGKIARVATLPPA